MEQELDFTVTIEKKDIFDYVFFHTYGKFRGKLFLAIGLLAFLMVFGFWAQYQVFHRAVLLFVGVFYLFVQPVLTYWKAKKLAEMPNFYVPAHYVFNAEEVRISQGEETITYRWEDGLLFLSRKRMIYMYVSAREAYMIPKQQVSEQYLTLLAMAQEHGCPVRAK